jgi:diadenosine tetraphosphate (Ap4A) HIT family hydrolase
VSGNIDESIQDSFGGFPMSKWNSPTEWQGLCDGSACPICVRGQPLDIIATLDSSWLTMPERAPMAGYVCLVSRVHAVDLHDLSANQAAAFIQDAHRVSSVLSSVTGSVKLNYEIHGNTLPHLHMHFFPRYAGDPFEGRAIEPFRVTRPVYGRGQFAGLRERLVQALATPQPWPSRHPGSHP